MQAIEAAPYGEAVGLAVQSLRITPRSGIFGCFALLVVSGCVLIVPTGRAGGVHCGFAGRETSCGTCMAAHCGAAVDACCGDDACGGIITDLEGCSVSQGTEGASCDRLLNAPEGNGVHRDLSTCAKQECRDVCTPVAPGSRTACKPAYASSVDACTCSASSPPNGTSCTSVGHPNLKCCAPAGWPAQAALECNCLTIICPSIIGGCQCQLSRQDDNNRPTTCDSVAGKPCCENVSNATCSCTDKSCLDTEKEVPTCTIANLHCSNGEKDVGTCSASK